MDVRTAIRSSVLGTMAAAASCLAIPYPLPQGATTDASYKDIRRDYHAVGDGVTDDTKAFRDAGFVGYPCVYIPNGTYLIADTVLCAAVSFSKSQWVGESREKTVIRLKENSPIFANAASPKKLFNFSPGAYGLQEFRHGFRDMTIEIGAGNAGAIGLSFFAANSGEVRDVTIRSLDPQKLGRAGIQLSLGEIGPVLISHVSVEGFDYGIEVGCGLRSMTLDSITVRGQRIAGIYKRGSVNCPINNLHSINTVPAVRYDYGSNTLLNSLLEGGTAIDTAVVCKNGTLYVLNTTIAGYGKGIKPPGAAAMVSPGAISEWSTASPLALFSGSTSTVKLPVEQVPVVPVGNPSTDWIDADRFGANADAIQQAIDAGKKTVFLSKSFTIDKTIEVRGNVERIIAIGSDFRQPCVSGATYAVFRVVDANTVNPIEFDNIALSAPGTTGPFVEHASTRTVILRNIGAELAYRNTVGGGKVFMENIGAAKTEIRLGQRAWIRSTNPEGDYPVRILNDASHVWILGIKTEDTGVNVKTVNCGMTQLFNGWFAYGGAAQTYAGSYGFETIDSDITAINCENGPASPYAKAYKETRSGVTRTSDAGMVSLYTGVTGNCAMGERNSRVNAKASAPTSVTIQGRTVRVVLEVPYSIEVADLQGAVVLRGAASAPCAYHVPPGARGVLVVKVRTRSGDGGTLKILRF